jgi:hypothetical protein
MYRWSYLRGSSLLLAGLLGIGGAALAQGGSLSDAQVEANVLRALAGSSQLATQSIKTTTVYGTVTLSGTVSDEASRTLAETLASRAPGVQKVVDELTLGSDTNGSATSGAGNTSAGGDGASNAAPADPSQGSNPQLQSDGTMAPPPDQQQTSSDPQQQGQNQAPEPGYVSPPAPPAPQGQYPQQPQYPQNQYPQGQYPQNGQQQGQQYPGGQPVYRQPYGQQRYSGQPGPPPPGAQEAGKAVTVPNGALLRVRLNEGLSSKHVQPGAVFDATVLNDVVADGEIAIPRGATVQGTIVESKNGGSVGGKGELALQLTNVTLGGKQFPILSDTWTHTGPNTGGRTASNVIGLGALGALIGAAAGGGPGAAIGAVAGGATGVGVSAAQGPGRVVVPAEAILTFHLAQPAPVTTVSQAEIDRLGYSVQPGQLARRPPPPPGYYYPPRPVYYPYPY